MNNWKGKNVLVIGAARQGLAATRFLSKMGASVTLNDGKNASIFEGVTKQFTNLNVQFHFGGHPLALLDGKDVICVSGGVPLNLPVIQEARKRKIPLTNDTQIFLEQTTAHVIGITGSAGKTTTTTFIGEIAKSAVTPPQSVWVGGNIGNPLIDQVSQIKKDDWVVMELSSFQLELTNYSPEIALVLNITPNHLDRHKTMKAYIAAKANILINQNASGIAILNRDEPNAYALRKLNKGKLYTFGNRKSSSDIPGTYIRDGFIIFSDSIKDVPIMPLEEINLPGEHNHANALAACTAGVAAGFSIKSIRSGIQNVRSIPHRLELVIENNHIRWINDSIATAPERVLAALDAINGPLVLLLGGRDKNLPWDKLAQAVAYRKPKLILFGEAGEMIENIFRQDQYCGEKYQIDRFKKFEDAVLHAKKVVSPGESVLLSPGGTSYDAFADFEERGNIFRDLVEQIA